MKRLLIISPYFTPINAADTQRIRMSLPYYNELGWEVEIVTVNEKYIDRIKDPLLLQSIPPNVLIHKISTLSQKYTSKIGLGSLALRSMYFYRKKVNQLLRKKKYDLIFFSTTEFPICILGAYWKRKFNIPYLIDMQDPWYTDHYESKPKSQRPKKYWFSHRLHRYLEPIAMKSVDGLMSVSQSYIDVLKSRYAVLENKPAEVITFGAFEPDFKIARENDEKIPLPFEKTTDQFHIVYTGRGGYDMQPAVKLLFEAFKTGLESENELFSQFHFHFIGTSYAPKGEGKPTIVPIAEELGINNYITEYTDRVGYYQSIKSLNLADGILIIGSDDQAYNASKLYPYILAKKPLLAIFHPLSNAAKLVCDFKAGELISLSAAHSQVFIQLKNYLTAITLREIPETDWQAFEPYTSAFLTKRQIQLFEQVIRKSNFKKD